jgi:ascorbate-specific PTS system EIIC-type component UlaA
MCVPILKTRALCTTTLLSLLLLLGNSEVGFELIIVIFLGSVPFFFCTATLKKFCTKDC